MLAIEYFPSCHCFLLMVLRVKCRYLYFLEKGNQQVTGDTIKSLAELIKSETKKVESGAEPFINSTLRYIEFQRQQEDGGMNEKYEKIKMEWFE